jgi:hypothetical protein
MVISLCKSKISLPDNDRVNHQFALVSSPYAALKCAQTLCDGQRTDHNHIAVYNDSTNALLKTLSTKQAMYI